ncbi:MAG: DUF1653 domain-containing protein [Candidatus Nomurabacteria bacterium]|jgi:hypothetical protein|nr:DUF1653 domain-containing protein [Candidatus Nomurabacteria bacterium]
MAHLSLEDLQKTRADVEKTLKIGDIYRHYKNGHLYKIHSLSVREEDDAFSVNYEDVETNMIFNRKVDSFLQKVEKDAKIVPRFAKID